MVVNVLDKSQVKDLIQSNESNYHLIDVRSAEEAASDKPLLPTAHNVPLPEFEQAMKLSDTEFKDKYKFNKPKTDEKVVVYCLSGRRAGNAASTLENLGYSNVFNYVGSASDWYSNN